MGIGGAGAYVGGVAGVPARGGITGAGIGRGGAIADGGVGSAIEGGGAIAGGATPGGAIASGVMPVGNGGVCVGLLYCFKVASTLDHS